MNDFIFSEIQQHETAYWLGFLAADGSIYQNKLEIGLARRDEQQLLNFKKYLNCDANITQTLNHCSNNDKYYPTSYITIYNSQIVQDLEKYSIIKSKSALNIDFLSYIPEKYKIAFIFGLFDGDGWFSYTDLTKNFGFCGNELTIKSIANYLNSYFKWDNPIKTNFYKKSPTTFYFQSSSTSKIKDFTNLYLSYKDLCPLLERKKLVAIALNQIEIKTRAKKSFKAKRVILPQYEKQCLYCGNTYYTKHIEQKYCSQECVHKVQQKVERPNREQLKNLIRTHSFLSIGNKYGVSDNAIRKWCKAMELPYRSKDIKSYSDEEWKNI